MLQLSADEDAYLPGDDIDDRPTTPPTHRSESSLTHAMTDAVQSDERVVVPTARGSKRALEVSTPSDHQMETEDCL